MSLQKIGYLWGWVSIISAGIAGILLRREPSWLKPILTIGVSVAIFYVIANIIAMFYGIAKARAE